MQVEVSNDIKEELIANLHEFHREREVEASDRSTSEWSDTHSLLDKLEARESTFRWMRQQRPTNEEREKETAKSDLDSIVCSQNREVNEFIELGKRAFYGATSEPRELALYLAERINELRIQREVESASQPKESSFDGAMHFIKYAPQNYIPRRFFHVLIGYKCEELKQAIDDYNPQTEHETSSLGEWPMSDEVLERFKERQLSFKHLCLLCYAYNWNPRYYDPRKYSKKETATREFLEKAGKKSYVNNSGRMDGAQTRSKYTLRQLAEWLDISQERTRAYVLDIVELGIEEEAKSRFDLFILH